MMKRLFNAARQAMTVVCAFCFLGIAARQSSAQTRQVPEPPLDEAQVLAETDARILRARSAPLRVVVTDAAGKAMANQAVTVDHLRHWFYFGAGFEPRIMERPEETEEDRRHREHFLQLFNYSTVHLYWGSYERQAGSPESVRRIEYARWIKNKGLVARGHPVFWNQDNTLPRWLWERDPAPAQMRELMDARLKEMSSGILPELRDADIFNELVHWERFKTNPLTRLVKDEGKVPLVVDYLKAARRQNPGLQLVVNDYDNSPAYYALLKELLAAGAPIDIIGQQSHMHSGNWSVSKVWECLNRLSSLNRPVLFSEHSVLSGPRKEKLNHMTRYSDWFTDPKNEQKQAEYLEQFYRLAYSHTNCIGVVLWNYSDRGAWLGAPVGILRKDGTPKPSYERLNRLINEKWRTSGEFRTDARGEVTIPNAFEGHYQISSDKGTVSGDHRASQPLNARLRL